MLYSKYSNPIEFVYMQINRGRFGTFVTNVVKAEYERKKAEAEKDREWKLWVAYFHSDAQEDYGTWRNRIDQNSRTNTESGNDSGLDDNGIMSIINGLFPSDGGETE